MNLHDFFTELRRRRVVRVAIVYVGAAFVVLQAADLLFPAFQIPDVAFLALVVTAILWFPAALVLSWAFDVRQAEPSASTAAPADAVPATPPARSVAVLPFVNMSADPENEYFSDGLSEELLNVLAKVPDLRVSARTSSFAFKGENHDVRKVARRLGVSAVVEGSVRKAGDRVRITVQLIDAREGYHLWSEAYDRRIEDIFAIQGEIARRIADALEVRLGDPAERALRRAPTHDMGAYELYLRGRHHVNMLTRMSLRTACALFRDAIKRDPSFAPAYAGLSDALVYQHVWLEPGEGHLEEAERASRRAVELAPDRAESHTATGWVLSVRQRFDEAASHFEEAIRRDPSLYDAWYLYARSRFAEGELEEAAELLDRAHQARPDEYQALALRAMVLRGLGRTEEARRVVRSALEALERHLELNPEDVRAIYMRAQALCELGRRDEGKVAIERAEALAPDDSGVLYNIACFWALAGDSDRSLAALERALEVGTLQRAWAENDPDLTLIRESPRFPELLERMS